MNIKCNCCVFNGSQYILVINSFCYRLQKAGHFMIRHVHNYKKKKKDNYISIKTLLSTEYTYTVCAIHLRIRVQTPPPPPPPHPTPEAKWFLCQFLLPMNRWFKNLPNIDPAFFFFFLFCFVLFFNFCNLKQKLIYCVISLVVAIKPPF